MNSAIQKVAVTCFVMGALAACSPPVLDFRNATLSNGLIYQGDSNEPFNGKITNVPESAIVPRQLNTQFLSPLRAAKVDGQYMHFIASSLCDVDVKRGLATGKMLCKMPGSQVVRYEMTFNEGVLDGEIKLRSTASPHHLVVSGSFEDGKLQGPHEAFDPASGKKVWEGTWKAGALDGPERGWHAGTSNLAYQQTHKDGKLEGPALRYAEDGVRVVYRATFVQGLFEGVEEQFDIGTGNPVKRIEWKAGRKHGTALEWNGPKETPWESSCVNGQCTTTKRSERLDSVADTTACVDQWTTAHRKEVGADAPVRSDQLDEWSAWCRDGKKPA